jgi:hypothetical protein
VRQENCYTAPVERMGVYMRRSVFGWAITFWAVILLLGGGDATTGMGSRQVQASSGCAAPHACVAGIVGLDVTGTNVQAAQQIGVPATVELLIDADGDFIPEALHATQQTDSAGRYQFEEVPVTLSRWVKVRVRSETLPAGLYPTWDTDHQTTPHVASGYVYEGGTEVLSFQYTGSHVVGSRVWFDANRDGRYDAEESGAANIPVQIRWAGFDAVVGSADDAAFDLLTRSDGSVYHPNLPDGRYQIRVTAPAGMVFSPQHAANVDESLNSDVDANGLTAWITIEERLLYLNAGLMAAPTATPTASRTATASATGTATPRPTNTTAPQATATRTPTSTPPATATPTSALSSTPTRTATATVAATTTVTATASATGQNHPPTPTRTATATAGSPSPAGARLFLPITRR